MGVSSGVVIFVLVCGFSQISGSVIPKPGLEAQRKTEKFNIRITEKGTTFYEKIDIDEDQEIAYFEVPGHNGLSASDVLYDFKTNATITRLRSKGACYIGPLPEDLPRPTDLKNGLEKLAYGRPSQNMSVSHKYWAVRDQLDKTTLRREARDFCDLYPVYRLQEYDPDSVFEKGTNSGRIRRQVDIRGLPFCDKTSILPEVHCRLNPASWVFKYFIRDDHCTFWITCKHDFQKKEACSNWEHKFNSMICYVVSCP